VAVWFLSDINLDYVDYRLCITYKLLSQTLDISSWFFQHFSILLYIVQIQLFLLPEQINHYYYYYYYYYKTSS